VRTNGHGGPRDLERTLEALEDGSFKWLREDLGMSQGMLARSVGLEGGELSNYERGKKVPRTAALRRLAQALRGLERMARARESVVS
jgi:DNA-binding transcriptional regulator YiaG